MGFYAFEIFAASVLKIDLHAGRRLFADLIVRELVKEAESHLFAGSKLGISVKTGHGLGRRDGQIKHPAGTVDLAFQRDLRIFGVRIEKRFTVVEAALGSA